MMQYISFTFFCVFISSLHFRYKVWFLSCNELPRCSLLYQLRAMIGFLHILELLLFLFPLLFQVLGLNCYYYPSFSVHQYPIRREMLKCSRLWIPVISFRTMC